MAIPPADPSRRRIVTIHDLPATGPGINPSQGRIVTLSSLPPLPNQMEETRNTLRDVQQETQRLRTTLEQYTADTDERLNRLNQALNSQANETESPAFIQAVLTVTGIVCSFFLWFFQGAYTASSSLARKVSILPVGVKVLLVAVMTAALVYRFV